MLGLAVLPLATGCAIPTRVLGVDPEVARQATPAVIDSGLETLDDPGIKLRMGHLLVSPEMKAVERELVTGLLDGSLAALAEKDRAARLGELSDRYAAALVRALAHDVGPRIAPVLVDATRSAVKGAMDELVGSLASGGARPSGQGPPQATGLSPAIAAAMTEEIGPALQKVLREDLGPGLAGALGSDEVNRALGATAHVMGKELILGANEGLVEIQKSRAAGSPSVLESVGKLVDQGANLTRTLAWVGGAVAVLLAIWVIRLLTQRRQYQSEEQHRTATTRLLAEAMRAAEGRAWADELLGALEARFRDDEEALTRIRSEQRKQRGQRSSGGRMSAPGREDGHAAPPASGAR